MKNKIVLSFGVVVALGVVSSLNGVEFKPVGFKAVGMGGAGVASTRGSLAGYYNPALLRFSDSTTEVSANVGVRLREANLVDNADRLSKLDISQTLTNIGNQASIGGGADAGSQAKLIEAQNILKNIGSNNALLISATPSITSQMGDGFAIGIYGNGDVSMELKLDTKYLDIIVKKDVVGYFKYEPTSNAYSESNETVYNSSSLEYGINNKKHELTVNAFALGEVPISYAKAFDTSGGTWSIGGSIKPMSLLSYSKTEKLGVSTDKADDNSDDAKYETKYKSTFGLDLGVAYRPNDSQVTLGLVGKNLNSPKFKVDTTPSDSPQKDYKIEPLVRAGFSLPAWNNNLEFAFDADLTENETLITGEKSQLVGGGVEYHPSSWFSLRLGAMKDLASKKFDDGFITTAGLGFGLKWLQFDVSAAMSSKNGQYDGEDIPRYAAVNFSLISKWGDGYNQKQAPVKDVDIASTAKEPLKDEIKTLSPDEQNRIKKDSDKGFEELNKLI